MIVNSIGLEDDGIYTLTASNIVGETIAEARLNCQSNYFLYIFFLIKSININNVYAAIRPHFLKMPQDAVLHDFAEFEAKVIAEGIPRPTLHWIKDGKQVHLDENGVKATFENTSETQVKSDFSIDHFSGAHSGDVI